VIVRVYPASGTSTAAWSRTLQPNSSGAGDLRFSPDNKQLVGVGPFEVPVHRWDVATGAEIPEVSPSPWSTVIPETPIGLSPDLDGIVERGTGDLDTVGVGHVAAGTFTAGLSAPVASSGLLPSVDPLGLPAFTSDSRLFLLAAGDAAVPVFELTDVPFSHFAHTHTLVPPVGATVGSALSSDGTMLATTSSANPDYGTPGHNTLRITTLDGSRSPLDIPLSGEPLFYDGGLAFGQNGNDVAVALVDCSIDVIDARTGVLEGHLPSSDSSCGGPTSLAFSGSFAHGRIAESTGNSAIVNWLLSWDLSSGVAVPRRSVEFGPGYTASLRMTASGSRAVINTPGVGVGEVTHVLDATATGWTERRSFPVPAIASYGFADALSPDGSRLVATDTADVVMYDLDTGRVVWTVGAHDGGAWFADDGTLYTASSDAIHVRSADTGAVQLTLTSPLPPASRSAVGVPGSFAIYRGHAFTVDIGIEFTPTIAPNSIIVTDWPLATTDLIAAACNEAGRNLTPAEWTQYVGTFDAYEKACPNLP
jgi:WD40 repeat protein